MVRRLKGPNAREKGGSMNRIIIAVLLVFPVLLMAAPFQEQWHLKNSGQYACSFDGKECQKGKLGVDIKTSQSLKKPRDCRTTLIAILDSGVDSHHADLGKNLVEGRNFVAEPANANTEDDNLHGTHVAGLIGASGDEASGLVGICQRAKMMPVKIASKKGIITDSDILAGIQYAVSKGAKVVNGSFGGGQSSLAIKSAIKNASKTLFVVAAGNGDPYFGIGYDIDKRPVFPAAYDLPNLLVVAATDNLDQLAPFSNFGLKRVQIAAPGVNIVSTVPIKRTLMMEQINMNVEKSSLSGTSMATPIVTGAAALAWSKIPSLTAGQVRARIIASGDKLASLKGKTSSEARINLDKLLSLPPPEQKAPASPPKPPGNLPKPKV